MRFVSRLIYMQNGHRRALFDSVTLITTDGAAIVIGTQGGELAMFRVE